MKWRAKQSIKPLRRLAPAVATGPPPLIVAEIAVAQHGQPG